MIEARQNFRATKQPIRASKLFTPLARLTSALFGVMCNTGMASSVAQSMLINVYLSVWMKKRLKLSFVCFR